jgi:glucuronoarabinoxylan endo-1,4-beta-xylanase
MKSNLSSSSQILPSVGDSNFIFTQRPISSDDKFTFQTLKSYITTDVENLVELPTKFELMQNYPNPFNPTTVISYSVLSRGNVTLRVYNILGQEVRTLVNQVQAPGTYQVNFNASDLSTGMYIYQIQAGSFVSSKKMMLVK